MKHLFLVLNLFLLFHTVNSQVPSSCNIPSTLQTNYDADIKHLALLRIFSQNSSFQDSIDVSLSYQDTIWQGMAAIFNLTTITDRDSVFDNYCIHHESSNFIFSKIYVSVDTTYNWTQSWQNLNTITGIASLDSLLSKYGFTVTNFSSFGSNYATLTTNQNINVLPLCDSIETFSGVIYAEPNASVGFGNTITYNKVGNERFYNFTVGYGDCLSGCTSTHTFKFKVYNNCSVDYLGIFDNTALWDVLPIPVNCNITTNIKKKINVTDFMIYPNPTQDFINMEVNNLQSTYYQIINPYGQIIQEGEFKNKTKVSFLNLTSGIYLIKLYNQMNNGYVYYKLVKN